jgi:hypothetical protein
MSEIERDISWRLCSWRTLRGATVRRPACRQGEIENVDSDVFVVAWRRWDDVVADALPWLLARARLIVANRLVGGSSEPTLDATAHTT